MFLFCYDKTKKKWETIEEIVEAIKNASIIVVYANFIPEVYLELGIAIGLQKDIWMIGNRNTFHFKEVFPTYQEYPYYIYYVGVI